MSFKMSGRDEGHCLYHPGSGFANVKRNKLSSISPGIPLIKPDPRQTFIFSRDMNNKEYQQV